jgi:hypothetical protein
MGVYIGIQLGSPCPRIFLDRIDSQKWIHYALCTMGMGMGSKTLHLISEGLGEIIEGDFGGTLGNPVKCQHARAWTPSSTSRIFTNLFIQILLFM